MPIQVMKQTETMAIVKVSGTGGTIVLATDLLASTMVVSGTPTVNITFAQWNISPGLADKIAINRGAGGTTNVMNLQANASVIEFSGNYGYTENTANTTDIVVATTGVGEVYLTLQKVSGYASKIETAQFGVYDNTAVVGS